MASNRTNPETSNEAYRSLKLEDLNEMYRLIIGALSVLGKGTFEDISAYLRKDPAKIWKRMSELERMEVVYRPGSKKLLKSGRNGYEWMLTNGATIKTEKSEKALKQQGSLPEIARRITEIGKEGSKMVSVQPELF